MTEENFKNILKNLHKKYNDISDILEILDQHPIYLKKYGERKKSNNLDHCINSTADAINNLESFVKDLKKGEN